MKKVYVIGSSVLLACVFFAAGASAQTPKTINGGVLNGKAVSLPKPAYPESAMFAKVGGLIAVNVVIDEGGNVVSAEADPYDQHERYAADGSKLDKAPADASLIQAAVDAALQARFSPTILSGVSVKVKGTILYNFVADKSDQGPRVGDVNGPLLNNKALALPSPEYPAAARAVKAAGQVTVNITIGEDGSVIAASAVSGHPLLRAAAVTAARQARFAPLTAGDRVVQATGLVTYNFVLPVKQDNPQ